MIQVYLPTFMFVIVSWVSFLIKPEVVPGRSGLSKVVSEISRKFSKYLRVERASSIIDYACILPTLTYKFL